MWKELPYAKVESGYIQANQIASEVIKAKGDNKLLGVGGTPHVGVQADFKESNTRSVLTRKGGYVFL